MIRGLLITALVFAGVAIEPARRGNSQLPGDFDDNGHVDVGDALRLGSHWLEIGCQGPGCC